MWATCLALLGLLRGCRECQGAVVWVLLQHTLPSRTASAMSAQGGWWFSACSVHLAGAAGCKQASDGTKADFGR